MGLLSRALIALTRWDEQMALAATKCAGSDQMHVTLCQTFSRVLGSMTKAWNAL